MAYIFKNKNSNTFGGILKRRQNYENKKKEICKQNMSPLLI